MNAVQRVVAAIAMGLISTTAPAQFVKGNEAVTVLADGSRKVETPPLPSGSLAKPCPAAKAGCAGGGWLMVETQGGLMECTEIYARPGTCRPSTYGSEKRSRLWIVKAGTQWHQCQYPDLGSTCVSTKSLPTSAVQ
jgi:hypothetical protein